MNGIHLLGELFDCPSDTPELTQAAPLELLCVQSSRRCGMSVVGYRFHQFEPQGVTGVVLLAESHVAMHTWPEYGFASIDVFVCNLLTDNTAKAHDLFRLICDTIRPGRHRLQSIQRGGSHG